MGSGALKLTTGKREKPGEFGTGVTSFLVATKRQTRKKMENRNKQDSWEQMSGR